MWGQGQLHGHGICAVTTEPQSWLRGLMCPCCYLQICNVSSTRKFDVLKFDFAPGPINYVAGPVWHATLGVGNTKVKRGV